MRTRPFFAFGKEGKYHPNCYKKKFMRNVSWSSGTVLLWLIDELKKSTEQGHIFELKKCWLRYCSQAAERTIEITPSFRSRMSTFKEYIAPHVADFYDFVFCFVTKRFLSAKQC